MISNKIIHLLLCLLIPGSGFVNFCIAEERQTLDYHFIVEQCNSHHCERDNASRQCTTENCNHTLCDDLSLFEGSLHPDNNLFTIPFYAKNFTKLDIPFTKQPVSRPHSIPFEAPQQRTVVLRI